MICLLRVHVVCMYDSAAAVLTASQCFDTQARIPKVMFGCASPSHMIKVLRAFHGVRGDDVMRDHQCDDVSGDPLCSYCPGDCVDDSINEVRIPLIPWHGFVAHLLAQWVTLTFDIAFR